MSIDPYRDLVTDGLRARIRALRLSDFEMWLAYAACGGSGDLFSFQAYLYGALDMADIDWAALQHSLWEAENL